MEIQNKNLKEIYISYKKKEKIFDEFQDSCSFAFCASVIENKLICFEADYLGDIYQKVDFSNFDLTDIKHFHKALGEVIKTLK